MSDAKDDRLAGASEPWDGVDLAALLTLKRIGDNRFEIPFNESNVNGEVFGGQYLGQALSAALASGVRRAPHAMQGFFLRAARADVPLEVEVECVRDGRAFSHRRASIFQKNKVVFCADISLHDEELIAPSHQMAAPKVPPPESLRNLEALADVYGAQVLGEGGSRLKIKRSAELKPVDPIAGFLEAGTEPQSMMWMRVRQFTSSDDLLHYAVLAYMTDLWANAACRITHGRSLFSGETASTSLNHGIWFHRKTPATDWILFATDGPSTCGGTGFNRGQLFDRSGRLIASMTQEALVRRPG